MKGIIRILPVFILLLVGSHASAKKRSAISVKVDGQWHTVETYYGGAFPCTSESLDWLNTYSQEAGFCKTMLFTNLGAGFEDIEALKTELEIPKPKPHLYKRPNRYRLGINWSGSFWNIEQNAWNDFLGNNTTDNALDSAYKSDGLFYLEESSDIGSWNYGSATAYYIGETWVSSTKTFYNYDPIHKIYVPVYIMGEKLADVYCTPVTRYAHQLKCQSGSCFAIQEIYACNAVPRDEELRPLSLSQCNPLTDDCTPASDGPKISNVRLN